MLLAAENRSESVREDAATIGREDAATLFRVKACFDRFPAEYQ